MHPVAKKEEVKISQHNDTLTK